MQAPRSAGAAAGVRLAIVIGCTLECMSRQHALSDQWQHGVLSDQWHGEQASSCFGAALFSVCRVPPPAAWWPPACDDTSPHSPPPSVV